MKDRFRFSASPHTAQNSTWSSSQDIERPTPVEYLKTRLFIYAQISPSRDMIELEHGCYLASGRLTFKGHTRISVVTLVSENKCRNWRYLSTVADADSVSDAREGPSESCLVRLEDGDLMCVMRVGSGRNRPLARTYSSDGGKTWSEIDRLSAWSVQPRIKRLSNGVLVISTGRPGVAAPRRSGSSQLVDGPIPSHLRRRMRPRISSREREP